ncbi:MAG: sugar kinase [Candidatus Parcubacteria bacterium]|nr:MAG: sugar kinase [Candidatus Parcubacteria bacterium]
MKIITLGTGTLDIIFEINEDLKVGQKIDSRNVFFSLGGGALNAATTFKNLHLDYLAYFKLGNDLIGKIILTKIRKENLKSKIFFHHGESQFSVVILRKGIKKQSERTILVYRGISDHFNSQELKTITKSDFYYLTTVNTEPKIFLNFIKRIRIFSKLISINPSKKFLSSLTAGQVLKNSNVIFLNKDETSVFLKCEDNPINLGKMFVRKINPLIFVLTLGEKGSITFWQNKIFIADTFRPAKLIDTTGAGDAFNSAFFANLVGKKDINEEVIKQSIIWGSANASANVEKLGAQIGLLKKDDYKLYRGLKIKVISWKR